MKVWFLKYLFKVLNWVKTFVREKVLSNVNHVKGTLSLLFTLEIRCKGSSQLYDHIAMQLGRLMGTVDVSPQSVTLIAVHSAMRFILVTVNIVIYYMLQTGHRYYVGNFQYIYHH